MNGPLLRGWCPGAHRPMRSGDGLILRLRITGGRLAAETARAIAEIASRYGNGELDLGRRGSLQLRGVREEGLVALELALVSLGLLDKDAAAEAVRNVVASPLSDCDETAKGDALVLARCLEAALIEDERLRALPAKFGFSIDDGGRFGLIDVPADIRLRLGQDGTAISLDGDPWATMVRSDEAVASALRLARAFLDLRQAMPSQPRRMAALIDRVGAGAVLSRAGLAAPNALPTDRSGPMPLVGAFPSHVGVAAPFGRLTADQLRTLADVAVSDLRLTPFRSILLPGAASESLSRLAYAGFVIRPDDPILAVTACPGAPACEAAHIETRHLARRLAGLNVGARGVWLHVSGCEKGCASSASHAVTLVGRDGGLDVVLDGKPTDQPRLTSLSPEAAEAFIRSGTFEQ